MARSGPAGAHLAFARAGPEEAPRDPGGPRGPGSRRGSRDDRTSFDRSNFVRSRERARTHCGSVGPDGPTRGLRPLARGGTPPPPPSQKFNRQSVISSVLTEFEWGGSYYIQPTPPRAGWVGGRARGVGGCYIIPPTPRRRTALGGPRGTPLAILRIGLLPADLKNFVF